MGYISTYTHFYLFIFLKPKFLKLAKIILRASRWRKCFKIIFYGRSYFNAPRQVNSLSRPFLTLEVSQQKQPTFNIGKSGSSFIIRNLLNYFSKLVNQQKLKNKTVRFNIKQKKDNIFGTWGVWCTSELIRIFLFFQV